MDLKIAIGYVKQYRFNGRSCYVHAENRDLKEFRTNRGLVRFQCHRQGNEWGHSSTKFCAYLYFVETGKAVPSKMFGDLVAL